MMITIFKRITAVGLSTLALAVGLGSTTFAHVVVKPAEVVTAGFQTFTVGVPNEKDVPTTSVKLVIPDGLKHIQPTQKTGWQIDVEKQGSGEDAVVKSITWSGSEVAVGFRDEFTFSGQVPDRATELRWKAYQTYSDGTIVSWDRSSENGRGQEGGNFGPFSVTKVVSQMPQDIVTKEADQAAASAQTIADRSLYVGVAALVVGIIGVFLATRKK